jgi:hypothetical protein
MLLCKRCAFCPTVTYGGAQGKDFWNWGIGLVVIGGKLQRRGGVSAWLADC